jgi:hypothetical protein
MVQHKLPPLDYKYYDKLIQKDYFYKANALCLTDNIESLYKSEKLQDTKICRALHIKGILKRLKYFDRTYDDFIGKYCAYLVFKPFELLFTHLTQIDEIIP